MKGSIMSKFPLTGIRLLSGIAFTIVLALCGGLIGGYILRALGSKQEAYEDNEEFIRTEK
jgi:uncharacterized membrane protein YeaQ/YmgE (transglycosylase-associated protein family)